MSRLVPVLAVIVLCSLGSACGGAPKPVRLPVSSPLREYTPPPEAGEAAPASAPASQPAKP